MYRAVRTEAGWTSSPSSPEVVRALANAAAVGEIAIRKAANSAGGRLLASVIREYPLWSVFVASSLGFLIAGRRRYKATQPLTNPRGDRPVPKSRA